MSDSFIPIQDPSTTNSKLDAEQLTVGANTVLRERMQIGGDGATEIAAVQNTLATTEMGLVVRPIGVYAEDAAASSADPGYAMLAVRRDTAASSSGTDGDYSTLNVDSSGRLWVNASGAAVPVTDNGSSLTVDGTVTVQDGGSSISVDDNGGSLTVDGTVAISGTVAVTDNSGSLTVDNGGTFAVQESGAALTALQLIDDAIVADDAAFTPATTKVMMAGFEFDDTTPDSVNEGDAGAARMSANRNVYTQIRDAAGNERGANVNASNQLSVSVDNTVTVASHAVTNAGTFAVQESGAALTALQLIDNLVLTEDAAHSSGDPGVMMLGVRNDNSASRTTLDGDYSPISVDEFGRLMVGAVFPGTGATALGKTEDSAHGSSDMGVAVWAVRRDAAAVGSGTDGDYSSFNVDGSGRLWAHVGIVDQVTPGTGATDLGKAEDAAHTSGDVGVMALAVRKDSAATIAGTDGDYTPLQVDSSGSLRVLITGGAGSGGTSATDESAYTPTSSAGTPIMGAADETSPDAAAEGTLAIIRSTLNRALHVNLRDASGNEVSVGGGTQYDEDTAHVSGDKITMAGVVRQDTATALSGTDGDRTVLITDASGRLHVNVGNTVTVASHAVTNAGTFAVQVDGSALTALQLIDDPVLTDDAAFTPATTKVMMAGFEADESSTDSVDEGDAGAARMTLDRKQIVTLQPHTAGGLSTFMASGSDGSSILVATAQAVKASAGQLYGYYIYNPESAVTFVHFYNTAAASVTVGTTNPLFTIPVPAGSAANLSIPQGITFSNAGWSVAATTTAGGNTAPATGVSLVAWYA